MSMPRLALMHSVLAASTLTSLHPPGIQSMRRKTKPTSTVLVPKTPISPHLPFTLHSGRPQPSPFVITSPAFLFFLNSSITSNNAVVSFCRKVLRICSAIWEKLHPSVPKQMIRPSITDGVLGAIGNTPLVRIRSLSEQTGCEILGKAEFLNPGGSVKDRVALHIIQDALSSGALKPGGLITEGSAGSTGISLSLVAAAMGCKCFVAMPDDAAVEKAEAMKAYGATVARVPPVSITHPDHFVHVAERAAEEAEVAAKEEGAGLGEGAAGFFADQFENLANFRAHYAGTGKEIWEQSGGKVDAFVAAAGTGGTIAGVSCYLKEQNPQVKCFLVDPPGSGLYNRVTRGVVYSRVEAEGRRLRNPQDTITEGIGLNRLTANFALARLDGAFRGSDMEAVDMSRCLLQQDGLFLGSSSAMNCVGAVKVAEKLGPGHIIVTVLCDSGMRYLSKFYNQEYLDNWFKKTGST